MNTERDTSDQGTQEAKLEDQIAKEPDYRWLDSEFFGSRRGNIIKMLQHVMKLVADRDDVYFDSEAYKAVAFAGPYGNTVRVLRDSHPEDLVSTHEAAVAGRDFGAIIGPCVRQPEGQSEEEAAHNSH